MRPFVRLVAVLASVLAVVALAAKAETPFPGLAASDLAAAGLGDAGRGTVTEVIDGDTVALDGVGEVRLVGIQAPKLPLGREGFSTWPLAPEAKAALGELVAGRTFHVYAGAASRDRYGRVLGHLVGDDGLWIQGALVARGWARVYSFPDNRALVDKLLVAERAARMEQRGIWSHPFYRLRTPSDLDGEAGRFHVVEGRPRAASRRDGTVYLDFGNDWRSDFTLRFRPAARRAFEREGLAPEALVGRALRVRGWVERRNGPMIDVTHPEQIELLDE